MTYTMSQFDGTGPEGKGPQTGRGRGNCAHGQQTIVKSPTQGAGCGRGAVRGQGRGTGCGQGRGRRSND